MVQLHIYVFGFFLVFLNQTRALVQTCRALAEDFSMLLIFVALKLEFKKGQSSFDLVLRTEKLLGIVI